MLDIQTQIKKHAIFLLCGVLCGATERGERKKPAYKAGEIDGETLAVMQSPNVLTATMGAGDT